MFLQKTKFILTVLALIICMGVFSVPVFASDGGNNGNTLTVNAVWVDGDMLKIGVTDKSGVSSSLALRLADYVDNAKNSEFISIQAVDLEGNKSGVVQVKNPYYVPPKPAVTTSSANTSAPNTSVNTQNPNTTTISLSPSSPKPSTSTESGVPSGDNSTSNLKPFTPNGTGSVTDNAKSGDGKEFFTVTTEDKSVFYLIVDRQKNSENVYLLNAVTEDDLAALAKKTGKTIGGTSGIPVSETAKPTTTVTPETTTPAPISNTSKSDGTGSIIFVVIAALAVGGAAYYFKIYRGKKASSDYDDEDEYDNSENEYGNEDEDEDEDFDLEEGDENK